MSEKRLTYLEGLRGAAAIMVVLCHFGYAFYYALYSTYIWQANMPGNLDAFIATTPFNVLYNGKLAVRIFFLLCGYVICLKYFQTKDRKYLVNGAIKRYFRLIVPILFIEVITYLLMKLGAYHNGPAAVISGSTKWFMTFNESTPTLLSLLKETLIDCFFGQAKMYNNVLWIIKYEFLGSLMVYAILYVTGKWKYRDVLYVILIILCIRNDYVCIFIGMFLCDIMQNGSKFVEKYCKNKFILLFSMIVGMLFATYPAAGENLEHTIYQYLGVPMVIIFYVIGSTLLFWVLLNSERLQWVFNVRVLQLLGKYSFGIYLVHFPIIATFSSWFLVRMNGSIDYNLIMLLDFVLTVPLVLICATIVTRFVEPLGNRLANYVLNKIMNH
ncbi:acyltransferase family protein [Lachnotalea glycerini]|uniref:Acyltransferase n=1 Tax=Lachnotalea glycerini TaxID=1763509 RepID=A0A371JGC1_9FIRM|nr:acyltransferase [Lachnotalea glycerini]RDY31789.1 acyltransferase [Lachnotalea glycerini]